MTRTPWYTSFIGISGMTMTGAGMKRAAFILFLILAAPVSVTAATITLKEDTDLIGPTGTRLRTLKAGEEFTTSRVDDEWVYGSYIHDAGIVRGKVRIKAFQEQSYLRRKSDEFCRQMAAKGFVKHEGKWIAGEDKERIDNEAKGLVLFEGTWVSPVERDRLLAEREAAEEAERAGAKEVEETFEEEDEAEDPFDDTSMDAGDGTIIDLFADNGPEADDEESGEGPVIEDLTQEDFASGEDSDAGGRTAIDWTKSSKKREEPSAADDGDEGGNARISPEQFSKYFIPGMVGLGVIVVFIVILSARKGSRR
jgi:hypothetical protein